MLFEIALTVNPLAFDFGIRVKKLIVDSVAY